MKKVHFACFRGTENRKYRACATKTFLRILYECEIAIGVPSAYKKDDTYFEYHYDGNRMKVEELVIFHGKNKFLYKSQR